MAEIRRTELSGADTGIDEEMIRNLVHRFYDRVRQDEMLAPIFDSRIPDWGPHLDRMCEFWSSIALMSGRYHGQPMRMHAPLPIAAHHFARWLDLFKMTAEEICPPEAAAFFIARSERIAESLQLGIAVSRGLLLRRGEKLPMPEQGGVEIES